MTVSDRCLALKARLKAHRIRVKTVLACAGVDGSTWTRWQQGNQEPMLDTWTRVEAAAERLIREAENG